VVRNADQASDACSAVDEELAGFLGRPCQFALKHAINEAHRILEVVEEVSDAVADGERHDDGVAVGKGADCVGGKSVVQTEHGPVKTLERVVHTLDRNVPKIVADVRTGGAGLAGCFSVTAQPDRQKRSARRLNIEQFTSENPRVRRVWFRGSG